MKSSASASRSGVRIVPAAEGIREAAERLRAGKLVAFPTETVYGLGANALDPEAVARIFAAKGRPSTNPLIVHVADASDAAPLVRDWPESAAALAVAFWPGPLTLVVPKSGAVPDTVTAGGDTVGIRIPSHPVAREMLREAGIPVAAPSANRSEEVSPTTAQHVADSLGPWMNEADDLLILDGGPCRVGLESTVVDATTEPVRVLRPGMISAAQIAEIVSVTSHEGPAADAGPARSPGQRARHYAPGAAVLVLPPGALDASLRAGDGVIRLDASRAPVVRPQPNGHRGEIFVKLLPARPEVYATLLYAALREMDAAGVRRILVEEPPDGPEWAAIHDRLRRAAAPKDADEQ